jgi:endonuclease YncB( thermonuclease family)
MITKFSSHPTKMGPPYTEYRAICKEVYDGDTYTMLVDLGFHTYTTIRVRLNGVDTPEVDAKDPAVKMAGIAARDAIRSLLLDKPCVIHTQKDTQSSNRWVADVYLVDPALPLNPLDVAEYLLTSGLAAPYVK